jgi:hypothetical protein
MRHRETHPKPLVADRRSFRDAAQHAGDCWQRWSSNICNGNNAQPLKSFDAARKIAHVHVNVNSNLALGARCS